MGYDIIFAAQILVKGGLMSWEEYVRFLESNDKEAILRGILGDTSGCIEEGGDEEGE